MSMTIASFEIETVALTGEPAPGTSESFRSFEQVSLSDSTGVAFYSLTAAPAYHDGIWIRQGTTISLAGMRTGVVPGISGLFFDDVFEAPRNHNVVGQVAFGSSVSGSGVDESNNRVLWLRDQDGTISVVARAGDPAPGWTDNPPFGKFFNRHHMNDSGVMAILGTVNLGPHPHVPGDIIRQGIWLRDGAGGTILAVKHNDTAPGTGGTFLAFSDVHVTSGGDMVFHARAGGGLRHGLFHRSNSGTISSLAFEGDPAPGISGVTLGKSSTNSTPLMRAGVNDKGDLALFSIISGAGVGTANDHAIWFRAASGAFTLIAREGAPAPGAGAGVIFKALLNSDSEPTAGVPVVNESGQVLFAASLAGTGVTPSNDEGVWIWDASTGLSLVVRKGDEVPGDPSSAIVVGFPSNGARIQLRKQAAEVLLAAELEGHFEGHKIGLIHWSPATGAGILLREGDLLEVAPGDNRIIEHLNEAYPGFNSWGQIAFAAGVGSEEWGVFVATRRGCGCVSVLGQVLIALRRLTFQIIGRSKRATSLSLKNERL